MKTFLTVFIALISSVAVAQTIPDFTLPDAVGGKSVSLSAYSGASGVIIIFTGTSCPYDQYYIDRVISLINDYNGKLPVLLVNANVEPADAAENMKKYAASKGISTPYLADKDQVLMTALKVQKSPEAFLLKQSGGKFTVVYHGAIDDNPQVAADVKRSYLREAANALLEGSDLPVNEVRPVGCNIRKK